MSREGPECPAMPPALGQGTYWEVGAAFGRPGVVCRPLGPTGAGSEMGNPQNHSESASLLPQRNRVL